MLIARRRPTFPAGAVGSISHSGAVAVAIAGATARFRSLGVDVEMSTVPLEAAHLVLAEAERSWLAGRTPPSRRHHLRRAFSAKEAAYKALFPLLPEESLTLRHIRLQPTSEGFTAWAEQAPGLPLAVTVRDLGRGVLSWTTAPNGAPATEPEGAGMDLTERTSAERLDKQDELSRFREDFLHPDPDLIYLDGNSLGRLPLRTSGA